MSHAQCLRGVQECKIYGSGEGLQAVVVNFVRYAIIYMLNTYFHIYVKETE